MTAALQDFAGLSGFGASAALLIYSALAVARRRGATTAERFWIALSVAATQVAAISMLLSPARWVGPQAFLLVQLAIGVVAWIVAHRAGARRTRDGGGIDVPRGTVERTLTLLVAALVIVALAIAAAAPVSHFDDRAYRASRTAYWLQHRSVLPWESHNDRQTAFPFGSEMAFFWPVLFTRSELAGRVVFACAVPLCAIGIYTVIRQARGTRTTALAGALLLLTAPAFTYIQEGLFPDLWATLFVLGTAFFALRACVRRGRRGLDVVMLGAFAALAANAKTTALAILPVALFVPWLIAGAKPLTRLRGTVLVAGGFTACAILCGLALVFAMNVSRDGHPLGSRAMRAWHTAEPTAVALRTQAARFVVSLIDVPVRPPEFVRRAVGSVGESILRGLGAAETLPKEDSGSRWPGAYRYGPPRRPSTYSLTGIAWLPALAAAIVLAIPSFFANRPDRGARQLLILALASVSLLVVGVLSVRWMGQSERFRVPAFAPGVVVIAVLAQRVVGRWPAGRGVAGALLLVTVLPMAWERLQALDAALHERPVVRLLDEPFHRALGSLPPGSHVLLVGSQDTRDYGLFRPRDGFASRVTSWGKSAFDAARMRRLMNERGVTHVLVQDEDELYMEWDAPLVTAGMVRWLGEQADLVEIPIDSPGTRLFHVERRGGAPATMAGDEVARPLQR